MADDHDDSSLDNLFDDIANNPSDEHTDDGAEPISDDANDEQATEEPDDTAADTDEEAAVADDDSAAIEATEEDEDDEEEEDDDLPFLTTLDQLGIDFNWQCPITPENIAYLAEQRPFIQLTTADGVEAYDQPVISYSKAGWTIVNYGDALCCSPGNRLFNYAGLKHRQDEDEGDGEPVGTIRGQTFLTAGELVALAKQQGWENIHVVDGLPGMIWATWIHAIRQQMSLSNYNPTETDLAMRERLERGVDKDRLASKGVKHL